MSNEQPWYTNPEAPLPFKLRKKFHSNRQDAEAFQSVALFPWNKQSLESLWDGAFNTEEMLPDWYNMIDELFDAVAVGGASSIHIFFVTRGLKPTCVQLPLETTGVKLLPADCIRVAWAVRPNAPLEPLIIFSRSNVLYIYNVRRKGIAGYLRGHGGSITSIAVHPTKMHLFCTTSRDYSVRIYDLQLEPAGNTPSNPCWPPGIGESFAGPAHGLQASEQEGTGIGRCIMVLMGGRSGGHQAAVLGAAFHPKLPVVATCGLDRLVKIWHMHARDGKQIVREDKPLFSSGRIHKARVLSVSWLADDILATHSAPALMRKVPYDAEPKEHYLEAGTVVLWRWLGMDRFFPGGLQAGEQKFLRGCASDYQESSSFKVISTVSFPEVMDQISAMVVDVVTSQTSDPLMLFTCPHSDTISILNFTHMPTLAPPPFPMPDISAAKEAERSQPNENREDRPGQVSRVIPPATGWDLRVDSTNSRHPTQEHNLMACAMGLDGRVIVGVGTNGSVWIWARK